MKTTDASPFFLSFFQGEDDSSWYGSSLVGLKRPPTEIDVIREWFVNIFQPLEKTADLVVTDFKFEQINSPAFRVSIPKHSLACKESDLI